MFRTDRMAFCEMYLQPEAAFETMSQLGDIGRVQFVDINTGMPPYLKNYVADICRCAELERKMRYVASEIARDNIDISDPSKMPGALVVHEMSMVENKIEKWETDIIEISMDQANLKQDLLEMKEMRYVLANIEPMLGNAELGLEKIFAKYKHGSDFPRGGRLFVMSGVVRRTKSFPFQLMLWRISHGNIYYRQANYDEVLEDPYTGGEIRKVAFLAICQGELLAARMQKIFTGFRVNIYPCPETTEERMELLSRVGSRIEDLEAVLLKAKYYRCKSLRMISREWKSIMIRIRKAKAVYHNLNLFTLDITKNCLIGQCWIPERDLWKIQNILRNVSEKVESNVESFLNKVKTNAEPPTTHRTNKFTYAFQVLINAYGDCRYGEVNPGIFTVISFPFLFAIMFGDLGHALIMVCFATWMLIFEKEFVKKPGSEIWNIFFGGRYVIFLLGLFSIFTGFVYNDIFSRAMNFGSSMWGNIYTQAEITANNVIDIDYRSRLKRPYGFGLDPIWTISKNKIMIENSIKMKMSLVIGIIHMLFGIILSIFNHVHFKKYYLIILQFIPEFTFLFCIFFWLVILIFYKWTYYYGGHKEVQYGCSCAPQILILFIDMVLYGSTEKKEPEKGCKTYLFEAQPLIQYVLVTLALVMVPILLLGTPIYINIKNKGDRKKVMREISRFRKYQTSDPVQERLLMESLEKYNVAFGELMVHQAVHTIEFVLSTISHSASYLRLWALSLAHSQLSEMLWIMILSKLGLKDHSLIGTAKLFVAFPVWAFFTVGILVVMEGLSAFLHTLRLHWVEFMSKFYIGEGRPFKPFYFNEILKVEVKTEGVCSSKMRKTEKLTMESVHILKV